jgi:hypothetical protein
VLLDPDRGDPLDHVVTVNCGDLPAPGNCEDRDDFDALTEIHARHPIDLSLTTLPFNAAEKRAMKRLLERDLLVPSLELANLGLDETLTLFVPCVDEGWIAPLVEAFAFFPCGTVRELEGRFFVKGMEETLERQHGLLITLHLPPTEFGALQRAFREVFDAAGVDHYLITSLAKAEWLLEHLYGEELGDYNPLKALPWNAEDTKWQNVKLFGEDGEVLHPELSPNDD